MPILHLPHKSVRLTLEAVRDRLRVIEAEAPSESNDFGNDAVVQALGDDSMRGEVWEGWFDAATGGSTLMRAVDVPRAREQGVIEPSAVLQYRFVAATYEEAASIHSLRRGVGAYLPMGEEGACERCGAVIYPEGSGGCWRCGPPK
jgi:hypothetical protein